MNKTKIIILGILVLIVLIIPMSAVQVDENTSITKWKDCITTYWNETQTVYKDIEYNYTCETDYFNYTINPKYAWCFNITSLTNLSLKILFSHSFLGANKSTKTIWWNITEESEETVTKDETTCTDIGKATILYTNNEIVHNFTCDYSGWGNCGIKNKVIYCDSKYDGNADGRCTSGESCLTLDISDIKVNRIKDTYRELNFESYDIRCWKEQ